MELRPYQQDFVDQIMAKEGNTLGILATGGGKTACASEMMRRLKKCWFLVHRDELVGQTLQALERFGLQAGAIKANRDQNHGADIQVAGVQTMTSRGVRPEPGTAIIVDEAHTVSFYSVVKNLIDSHAGRVIGLTATPWRAKRTEGLSDHYSNHVIGPTTSELIKMGFLTPPETYGFNAIDMSDFTKPYGGDWRQDDLAIASEAEESIETVVRESIKHSKGTAIVFCVSVLHAELLAERLPNSEIVTGETSFSQRADVYRRLREGKISFLCSIGVLTEGFDVTSIETVILARPTLSRALHVQMIGRGLRLHEGKTVCKVLDFAGNTETHGFAHKYTRKQMLPDAAKEAGEAPIKMCEECNALVPIQAEVCPYCGELFPIPTGNEKRILSGMLIHLDGGDALAAFKLMHGRLPPKGHPLLCD